MNKLLIDFKQKVLNTDENFMLLHNSDCTDRYYYFMQTRLNNNTKLIYGSSSYYNEHFYMDKKTEFKLCAIISNDYVYIVDKFLFTLYIYEKDNDVMLELNANNIYLFKQYMDIVYDKVKNEVFKDFYNNLEVGNIEDNLKDNKDLTYEFKKQIIEVMLQDKNINEFNIDNDISVKDDMYIKHLCEVINIYEIVENRLNSKHNIQKWTKDKIKRKSIEYIIGNKENYFTENELNLINVINELSEINCKNVTVEFEFDGKIASEKIELDNIKRKFRNNDTFSSWDFITNDKGRALINKLGITFDKERYFKCDKITRIMYRSKDVYIRK